ncbi:MAG TPA: aminopeptidase [Candidatus Nanoarchaeia archaeon]|nr:aminopeptidase [Candidatus Nanoarchaeia archaeon]
MNEAAKVILEKCMQVKEDERVLVIADTNTEEIGESIFNYAKKIANAEFLIIVAGKMNGEEPDEGVARKMMGFDVIICPTTMSLTHTKAVKEAANNGARVATLPGITKRIMEESIIADYERIKFVTEKLGGELKNKKMVNIKTAKGTDLSFSIEGRKWVLDYGIINKKRMIGNLPAGEVFIAPVEGSANGVIVVDSFVNEGEEYCRKDAKIMINRGLAVDCDDKESLLNKYFKTINNARNIAEFGIGTNYQARVIGNILQDEKVLGTCHIAFGNNSSFGGKVYSEMHIDNVIQKPTIVVDKEIIMKDGKIV